MRENNGITGHCVGRVLHSTVFGGTSDSVHDSADDVLQTERTERSAVRSVSVLVFALNPTMALWYSEGGVILRTVHVGAF